MFRTKIIFIFDSDIVMLVFFFDINDEATERVVIEEGINNIHLTLLYIFGRYRFKISSSFAIQFE